MTQTVSSSSRSSAAFLQQQRWFSSNEEENKEAKQEETTTEAGSEEETTTATEEEEKVNKEEELTQEIKSLKDQLLRSLAEQENIRNIARRDVEAGRQFSIKSFAKSLLEVSDNLTRALEHHSAEDCKANPQLDVLYQGVAMTNTGLTKALEANGVKKYCDTPGDVFNPEKHEALMEYPDPTKEPGTVGQVIKVGYTLNNRVLRPAEVGVIKKA
jgi:molecular chaperone GrpE